MLHLLVMSHQSPSNWNDSLVFLSTSQVSQSLQVRPFILQGLVHLLLPHDGTQAMHSWQVYNGNNATFSAHHIQGPQGQPIPLLVMLTLIIWPSPCLPDFTTDNSPCFYCTWLQFCGKLSQYGTNILILTKLPPTRLPLTTPINYYYEGCQVVNI